MIFTRGLKTCWRQGIVRPYTVLIILSALASISFSFLLFPRLVDPLNVHYMMADGYYEIAESLLAGNGFYIGEEPNYQRGAFKREPLYPLLLATIIGSDYFPLLLVFAQVFLYVCAVCMAYKLFSDFSPQRHLAFWSVALFSVFPYSYWYVAKPTPENVTPLLLLTNVWLCQRYLNSGRLWTLLAWSGSCGVMTLFKSNLILMLPVGLFAIWISAPKSWRLVAQSALAIVLFALIMTPWSLRNYHLSGEFIWGSSHAGVAFFVGNENGRWASIRNLGTGYRGERKLALQWKESYSQKQRDLQGVDKYVLEGQTDIHFQRQVLPWILDNKIEFAKKTILNIATMWFMSNEKRKSLMLLILQAPLMAGALLGVWSIWKYSRSRFHAYLIAIVLIIYLLNAAILGYARYVHVFLPIIFYFFVMGLHTFGPGRFLLNRAEHSASIEPKPERLGVPKNT